MLLQELNEKKSKTTSKRNETFVVQGFQFQKKKVTAQAELFTKSSR